ncbi:hypothetical protein F2Q69_00043741 [Brassica cretica]|uniref:Uncharacterized protein n=1 Tax=Brassica cretica TaxID=69181 RepID=A0A8S9NLC6_BRACR|nr:hypothetical protein F2Q69_00043741 [Brassica cretica]
MLLGESSWVVDPMAKASLEVRFARGYGSGSLSRLVWLDRQWLRRSSMAATSCSDFASLVGFVVPLPATPVMEEFLFGGGSKIGSLSCRIDSGGSNERLLCSGFGFERCVALCTRTALVVARTLTVMSFVEFIENQLLRRRYGKSRHPRQRGEPHIPVGFVKGREQ